MHVGQVSPAKASGIAVLHRGCHCMPLRGDVRAVAIVGLSAENRCTCTMRFTLQAKRRPKRGRCSLDLSNTATGNVVGSLVLAHRSCSRHALRCLLAPVQRGATARHVCCSGWCKNLGS